MRQATITLDNRVIPVSARTAMMVRYLIEYDKALRQLDVCSVEFQCGKETEVKGKFTIPMQHLDKLP
jgi:hypothetical protein